MVPPTVLALLVAVAFPRSASAVSITDIQGPAFQSPLVGQTLANITGVVSAKGTSSFWIQGPASNDIRASPGVRVFTSSKTILGNITVGDEVSLTARVSEFRSSSSPNDLTGTELDSPANVTVLSSNNTVKPVILGTDRSPPTQALSALDTGSDGWLSAPNNVSRIDSTNATLVPAKYGMDFWESLEGTLVTVPQPVALDFPNTFGEFWVRGAWPVTGLNGRGGLSLTIGPNNVPDANPETVIIGAPLDGTKNPLVAIGTKVSDITGVVLFQFGFFYILPTTAPTILSSLDSTVPPTTLTSSKSHECTLTVGDYNIENMAPTSAHLPVVAGHIANQLRTPDIMFVQEVQDNSGPTNDGTVIANVTLAAISNAILNASGGALQYQTLEIAPVDGQDGGQPGGNIRQAYLYNSAKMSLVPGSPVGGSLDATKPFIGKHGVQLTFNPGRIDPNNTAWQASRKPLVAQWQTPSGHKFYTINHHGTSKSGSASTQGDARPPVNLGVDQRTAQVTAIASFVASILHLDPFAAIIVAGDFNEFAQARSVFHPLTGLVLEADLLAGIPPVERYTYVFDQNCEQLDHLFVSPAVAVRGVKVEHVHVNNWSPSLAVRASDHDPSVAQVKVCTLDF
ncbi:DNase I-like protein [Auriscalpium vulgare]|uniref:DNase I-like protein n=1 Tax=Auriscalpium vulgare TaxID=40419 RepID=A0ACB8S233_9AGAM|nr:DNase I-like protein [Auriscalpium vulgare]